MSSGVRSLLGIAAALTGRQNTTAMAQSPHSSMSGKWSLTDDEDQPAEGYDEEFDPLVTSIMECPICLLVLRNPVQTDCGHRFCSRCILKVIREGRKKCPIDNEDLDESQIYPDNFAKREILQLTVHCRNFKTHGCEWHGTLKDLQTHLTNCLYGLMDCSNGCGVKVLRKDMEKHLKEECEKRIETCAYCKMKVVHRDMEEHCSTCPEFPIFCPNQCSDEAMKRHQIDANLSFEINVCCQSMKAPMLPNKLEDHLLYECPKATVKCPFESLGCKFEGQRNEVNKHFQMTLAQHITDFAGKFATVADQVQKEMLPARSLQKASPTQIAQKIVELEQQVSELAVAVNEAADKGNQGIQLAELYYSTQNSNLSSLQDSIRQLSDRFDVRDQTITELQAKTWNGNFVWKITNFDKLFQQALSGEVPAIHSIPFYSGIPGYKMCLRVNLNGVDSGASTHVSMFVHLMQGDFDSILPWPFPGKITLAAVDQTEAEQFHVTETLVSRPGLQAFLRPKTPRNHKGYGYVEMISHTVLRTREYIKNNAMIVHVSISLEN